MDNSIIEISKKTAKAGRTHIKLVLHEIYSDSNSYNKNGISWNKKYTEENMDSVKTSPIVTQFIDEDKAIPLGGHGEMNTVDGDIYFEDSLVVGAFEDAYIDDVEINGKTISALVGVGYIYNQRFPKLVEYLQEQYENNIPIEGSIEINADKSKGNTNIIYDGGYKEKGRIPQVYQYSGHALLFGETPADDSALMLEINSYKKNNNQINYEKIINNENNIDQLNLDNNINIESNSTEKEVMPKMDIIKNAVKIELNKLSYDDISTLITRAINISMGSTSYYGDYYIHRFYPQTSEVVLRKWDSIAEYYMTTYTVDSTSVSIGDIIKVEEDWKPINTSSQPVEVNAIKIKEILTNNKGGNKIMGAEELNAKITELSLQLSELNTKITELNNANVEKDNKITELNEALVNANKTLEEVNSKYSTLETELNEKYTVLEAEYNACKADKEKMELEKKSTEVNNYFDNEIPKNGFAEAEINSLKEFVEKVDLVGLKSAEADLIVKKFKESKSKSEININEIEINSKNENDENLFFKTKEEKKVVNDVEAGKSLFN